MIARSARCSLWVAGALLAMPWSASASIHTLAPAPAAVVPADASGVQQSDLPAALSAPFTIQIDALPAATPTVSLKRVRYESGVELAEQPIDGPRLILIEAGVLALEPARSGAVRFLAGSSAEEALPLAAGDEHQVAAGDIVLVPASLPLQLANRSSQPVVWLQVQAETPPTICACGEDLTGSETTLLASQTLEQPLAVPALFSVSLDELAPQQSAPAPVDGTVQLVAPIDAGVLLSTDSDGQRRNDSAAPVPIYVVTLAASPPTT